MIGAIGGKRGPNGAAGAAGAAGPMGGNLYPPVAQWGATPLADHKVPLIRANQITASPVTANTLIAVPFVMGRAATLRRLSIFVTAGAAGNLRIGIYDADVNSLAPANRLLDTGNLSLAAAVEVGVSGLAQALVAGALYWQVVITDTAVPNIIALVPNGGMELTNIIPMTPANAAQMRSIRIAQAFGALPAAFPATNPITHGSANGVVPCVWGNFVG